MGLTAEKVAQQWKVSREMQDAFALESHLRAIKAQQAGEFTDEITPIDVVERTPNLATGEVQKRRTVNLDEGPRPDTSLEGLAKLRPCSPHAAASRRATARRPAMAPVR
jgi:acetyl-CoA acyltransferase